jgi:hypothetical protein
MSTLDYALLLLGEHPTTDRIRERSEDSKHRSADSSSDAQRTAHEISINKSQTA